MPPELLNTVIFYGVRILGVILILLLAFGIGKWIRNKARSRLGQARWADETLSRFLSTFLYYAILVFAVLACLNLFGVNITSIVAVLAAAGFAVGLAFQGTLSNFAAGVMLLVFRPFRVGDVVAVAGVTGSVFEIELFSTTIDTADNCRFIVPNSEIYTSTIENRSHHPTRRVDVAVGTAYDVDLGHTRSVLERVAGDIEGALTDPEPVVYLNELGGSSINWSVRVWAQTSDYWAVRERLTTALKNALDDAEIGIPYPNMDLHIDGRIESIGIDRPGEALGGDGQRGDASEPAERSGTPGKADGGDTERSGADADEPAPS